MRFTELEKAEVSDRWQGGEAMRKIARRLGRESSSVRTLIEDTGGVRPMPRRRSPRCLSLTEREEISGDGGWGVDASDRWSVGPVGVDGVPGRGSQWGTTPVSGAGGGSGGVAASSSS